MRYHPSSAVWPITSTVQNQSSIQQHGCKKKSKIPQKQNSKMKIDQMILITTQTDEQFDHSTVHSRSSIRRSDGQDQIHFDHVAHIASKPHLLFTVHDRTPSNVRTVRMLAFLSETQRERESVCVRTYVSSIQKERTDWNPTTIAVTGEGVGKGENRRRRKDRRPEREEMRRRRMSESPETGGGERRGRE